MCPTGVSLVESVCVYVCVKACITHTFNAYVCTVPQAVHGGSTQGVAVHGTLKTDKVKAKIKKEKEKETGDP